MSDDLICKRTMRRCTTPSMCAPFQGCGSLENAELEAARKRIAELEAGIAEQLAPAACEWKERAERAEQRVAELERQVRDVMAQRDAYREHFHSNERAHLIGRAARAEAELAAAREDGARLDWLERNPRLAEITTNDGKTTDCYYYAVAGAPGLKLREIIDAARGQQ